MTIHVTLESLKAFFDYTNPSHPWQVDRQLLPNDPFFFSMEGFHPLAPLSKQAPLETRIRRLWASFRGDGLMPDLGFALWERQFWILAAAVEKRALGPPEHVPIAVLEVESGVRIDLSTLTHLSGDDHRAFRSLVSSGELAVRSQDNRLARGGYCVGGSTAVACKLGVPTARSPIQHHLRAVQSRGSDLLPRGVDAAMANQIARAIIANPCLQPPELIPDWQGRYLTGAVPGVSTATVSTVGSGVDDSSTPAPPPAARSSPPDAEEKESSGDTSLGVLAEAARRLSSG
ncbi:hypothetical protein F441_21603 [Phytophthora nicotianae CJ01A1]|uniref:Uncharacterized protein n=1 Tax=Phytophthora nicotianae CJ01A1 TaxID=1317063 RepID=W2VUS1_PHYNI|nr:hypothetical protein F441_21603 [Phytophthora nicotianae CJ01A1]